MASGEFLWIAEADDLSESQFLSRLIAMMKADPAIAFAFSDSRSIDAEGKEVYASYKPYYATIEPGALSRTAVFDGSDFATRYLGVKNTILNVSSVVWRRKVLLAALQSCRDELASFRMAGDWRLYLEALAAPGAKVAYVSDPLNVHRRHAESVTHSLKAEKHLSEIASMHRVAGELFRLPRKQADGQATYLEEVTRQLLGERNAEPAREDYDQIERTLAELRASLARPRV
jgi:hypothetical protein